jgi:hypothetical protein
LGLNHGGQIAVRRRDDADLDVDRSLTANADDLAILHHTEKTHLRRGRQVTHFVEEQRAAIGLLEPALSTGHGPGERSRFVAEQLRVDQFRRNRAAVHAPEGSAAKWRLFVNSSGNNLFAGSGFSKEEHRGAAL